MKGVDFENISYDSKCNAASSILLESVLKNRSHKVGVLIRAASSIRKLKLNSFSDFGEQCHTKNGEPYYYESAYLYKSDSQLEVLLQSLLIYSTYKKRLSSYPAVTLPLRR